MHLMNLVYQLVIAEKQTIPGISGLEQVIYKRLFINSHLCVFVSVYVCMCV